MPCDSETGGEQEIESKLLHLAASIFGENDEKLSLKDGPDDIEGWDSYAHTMIALEVEKTFDIALSANEVIAIQTLDDIARIISSKIKADNSLQSADQCFCKP